MTYTTGAYLSLETRYPRSRCQQSWCLRERGGRIGRERKRGGGRGRNREKAEEAPVSLIKGINPIMRAHLHDLSGTQ